MHEKEKLIIPVESCSLSKTQSAADEMLAGTRPHKRGKIVLEVIG